MARMVRKKIIVTGAEGLLGTELKRYLDFIPLTFKNCDVTDYDQVGKIFTKINPDITLHLAAISTVIEAAKNPKEAYRVNVEGTENVALWSKHLIYISTDYVFDGKKGNYRENDIPFPQTILGITKLLGEERTRWADKYTIIRTSFKEIPFKHNQAPFDMYTSADYVPIIAYHIAQAIKNADKLPKILHIV